MSPTHAPPTADLFGQVLLDYLRGARVPVHLRRGDGRLAVLDVGSYFSGFEAFTPLERLLISLARGSCLDLGAGAGRFALYLQELAGRGGPVTDVVALDSSAGACECMRRRGTRVVVHGSWERAAEAGIWTERFDTILLGGGGFGIAGGPEQFEGLLHWMAGRLRQGGLVLGTGEIPEKPGCSRSLRLRIEYRRRVGEWFDWLEIAPGELLKASSCAGLPVRRLFVGGDPPREVSTGGTGSWPVTTSPPRVREFGAVLEKAPGAQATCQGVLP